MSGGRRGFTLLEVMAVVALIGVVFFFALDFYADLSQASTRASEYTSELRRSTAILDRVARDFEGATLVTTPPGLDPIFHPWLFVGEARIGESGSDHIKFVTRNHDPMRSDAPQSDLAMVAYMVERDEDDRISLYRWSSPQLPESLDKTFPYFDDEGSYLVADGLSSFVVRFVDDLGGVRDSWDSTTLLESGQLPAAVEIELGIASPTDDDEAIEAPQTYQRRVMIPVRPLDLALLLDPEGDLTGTGTKDGAADGDDSDDSDTDGSQRFASKGRTSGSGSSGRNASKDRGRGGLSVKDCVSVTYCDQVPSIYSGIEGLLRQSDWPFDPSSFANFPPCMVNPACR